MPPPKLINRSVIEASDILYPLFSASKTTNMEIFADFRVPPRIASGPLALLGAGGKQEDRRLSVWE
jgi:hypothetical protein